MAYEKQGEWMSRALRAGTVATALWRGLRDETGELVDLVLVEADEGFAVWLGMTLAQMDERTYSSLVPTGVPTRLPLYLEAIRGGRATQLTFDRLVGPDAVIQAEVRILPCGDDLVFAQLFDVSAREARFQRAESARRTAELTRDRLGRFLDAAPDGFAVYRVERNDSQQVIRIVLEYVNEVAAAPTGRPPRGLDRSHSRRVVP